MNATVPTLPTGTATVCGPAGMAQFPWMLAFLPWTGHEPRPHKKYANGDVLPATAEDIEVWKVFSVLHDSNCMLHDESTRLQARIDQLEAENAELKSAAEKKKK